MALDMLFESEVLGRSVSAANRRTDLFELVRKARHQRDEAVARALGDAFGKVVAAVGTALTRLAYRLEAWRKRHATYGELMSLDDRMLSDIGVQRADIPAIAESGSIRRIDGDGRVVGSQAYMRAA